MLSVRATGHALGAEITGVDLAGDVDEGAYRKIVEALHEHEVVFFRGQELTPEQHVAFSRRFGELEHHVRTDCCRPGYPELFVVSNILENGKPIGSQDAGSSGTRTSATRRSRAAGRFSTLARCR